jgi:phosphoserine phosphatase
MILFNRFHGKNTTVEQKPVQHFTAQISGLRRLGWIALFFAFQSWAVLAQAEIVEIQSLQQILPYITKDSLVIFDIDNTLIEPYQMLGSDEWFSDIISQSREAGAQMKGALKIAAEKWATVHLHIPMKPVEPSTPELVQKIQAQGNVVMGLTARTDFLAVRTVEQLKSAGIDLLINPVTYQNYQIDAETGVTHFSGIVFVGTEVQKGDALAIFLAINQLTPKHLIFVDDKIKNAESVEHFAQSTSIDHVVFRYSANDHKPLEYNRTTADAQWRQLLADQRLIADHQALVQPHPVLSADSVPNWGETKKPNE